MSSRSLKQSIALSGLCLALGLSSAPLMAEDITPIRSSKSITYMKSLELTDTQKDVQLKQGEIDNLQTLSTQGYRTESTVMAAHISTTEYFASGDITVYDASTELISDFDADGFYHRYRTIIDADTIYDTSYIYARLYLSYEGGPWNYYASSDNYHIHGDSELDTIVIETELADGYPPGYYDIRIELYDADHDDWLTSYGPYDDDSLSALPLEDSYYDDPHYFSVYPVETEIIVASHLEPHGGSMSWLMISLPLMILITRRSTKRLH